MTVLFAAELLSLRMHELQVGLGLKSDFERMGKSQAACLGKIGGMNDPNQGLPVGL